MVHYVFITKCFISCAGAEPVSEGDTPAGPDQLIEDGEEREEGESTENISKEEAAERLMVGRDVLSPRTFPGHNSIISKFVKHVTSTVRKIYNFLHSFLEIQ